MASGHHCGMACCQKQSPLNDKSDMPQRSDFEKDRLPLAIVLQSGALGYGPERSSALAALFSDLESRWASLTLRAQHICMQV
jgi:hypothetical protein